MQESVQVNASRRCRNLYEDANGNTDTYTYNSSYELTGVTDDRGLTYTIGTNSDGYITSIEDPAGRTWAFTYDSSDNLSTITSPTIRALTSPVATSCAP